MRNIKLNTKLSLINNIYNFVLDEKLYVEIDMRNIKSKVKSFYVSNYNAYNENEIKVLLNDIEGFSFYDLNNYIVAEKDKGSLFSLINVLSIVKSEFINNLTLKIDDRMYMDFGGLERKASPHMETYEYLGNNKLDITPTRRSYGLLFE